MIPIRTYWFKCVECMSRNYIYDKDIYQHKLTENNCICKFCGHIKDMDKIKKYEVKDKMAIDMKKEKSISIEEKRHDGIIVGVNERLEPYHYIDVVTTCDDLKREDGSDLTLKIGFPATWTDTTALGQFLKTMGVEKEDGENIDVEGYLKNMKISYVTMNKKTEKGTFAEVTKSSIEKL